MKLEDFPDPFFAIKKFEELLSEYTGAPYAITTDCCTHAIELCMIAKQIRYCEFPSRTYLSIPMTMHKLSIEYTMHDKMWYPCYQFHNTNIFDCARYFQKDMYQSGTLMCLSFGRTKPLQIGQGGAILTDDKTLADKFNRMRYDGRDVFNYSPWQTQKIFELGYHYYLRPEEAIVGINLLNNGKLLEQPSHIFDYPNCLEIEIK